VSIPDSKETEVTRRWEAVAAATCLACVALALFLKAPTAQDFHWWDSPRHALNGIFVHDLIAERPAHPQDWAVAYYLRYPALTLLFYPPLFSGALAAAYAAFGVSHATAQGAVVAFHWLLGAGTYLLARRWVPFGYALGGALLLAGAPEVAFWGQQVVLDIPAYAWLICTALFFVRYLEGQRPREWYWTLACLLLAFYTKQTPVFVGVAIAVGLLVLHRRALLTLRHIRLGAALFVVCLVPLLVLHLEFGQVNSASVLGSQRPDIPRLSIDAWTYYGRLLPVQLGLPTLVLAAVYGLGCMLREEWRIPPPQLAFLVTWFVSGYAMFSFIMVREPRHDLMALLPVPLFAVLALHRLCRGGRTLGRAGAVLAIGVGLGTTAWGLVSRPVPFITGHRAAAEYVEAHAPRNSRVLFAGDRDGNFIFSMRAGARPDVSVLRADKMLARLSIERSRGVEDRGLSPDEIETLFRRHGVTYVVSQVGYWTDLPSFAALEQLLADPSKCRPVHRIETMSNTPVTDGTLVIWEYLGEVATDPPPMPVELVGIGRVFAPPRADAVR